MNYLNKTAFISCLNLGVLAATASAQLVYQDNFDGPATTLNGVAPDVRPGSETWASENLNANGSISTGSMSSWLPYTFAEDMEYTLTLSSNFAFDGQSSTPVYLGFTENSPFNTGNMMGFAQNTFGILAVTRGGGYEFLPGPNNDTPATATGANSTLFNQSGVYDMQLVLTTYSTQDWTLTGYVDGVQIDLDSSSPGLVYTFTEAKNFTGIGMGYHSSTFTAEGFEFSEAAIPEPSTYALLGGSLALGLAFLRRRRA
ncbi:MAG: PEP-CTERM sorting domain-containing protein [Puniceicoccales bacterium]